MSRHEKSIYRVYHKPFPKRGRFSALCHVKPLNPVYELPVKASSAYPEVEYDFYIGNYRWGNQGDAEKVETLTQVVYTYGLISIPYSVTCVDGDGNPYPVVGMVTWHVNTNRQRTSFNIGVGGGYSYNIDSNGRLRYHSDMGNGNWYPTWTLTRQEADAFPLANLRQAVEEAIVAHNSRETGATPNPYATEDYEITTDYVKAEYQRAVRSALRFDDTQLVDYSVGAQVVPWAFQNIDVIAGRSGAFVNATKDVPLMSDNALQNLSEAFAGLASFAFSAEAASYFDRLSRLDSPVNWYKTNARGLTARAERARRRALNRAARRQRWDPADVISSLTKMSDPASDAWLKGRYAFSTSVMDLGQGWDYFYDRALQTIGKRSADYKCHGRFDRNDIVFRCNFIVREKALTGVTKFFEHCYRHGFEPNAYVMWDFVPFSFVVDWFFPIGNALEAYTRASHFVPEYWEYQPRYDGNTVMFSATYTTPTAMGPMEVYTRWYEAGPPDVEPVVMMTPGRADEPTVIKRVIDGIALFH